jgi:hypothetical protein
MVIIFNLLFGDSWCPFVELNLDGMFQWILEYDVHMLQLKCAISMCKND